MDEGEKFGSLTFEHAHTVWSKVIWLTSKCDRSIRVFGTSLRATHSKGFINAMFILVLHI